MHRRPWEEPGVPASKATLLPGLGKQQCQFLGLPDSPPGLLPFLVLIPVGRNLSSRLEELRSESLSLSLETTGKDRGEEVTFSSPHCVGVGRICPPALLLWAQETRAQGASFYSQRTGLL